MRPNRLQQLIFVIALPDHQNDTAVWSGFSGLQRV